ncbi:MAG: Stk1 family PASTA domain-containing Ser/Thr kinase [Actinomycetota bacterium]|nr:Stk1 family PASTA domain-containing Ser/Thr kinase [Actinomycetota bacterium]
MGRTITDPLVGTVVDGRYEVLSRIARGGMATVYLAVDRRLDREVALKVMHAHLADGADGSDFIARFRREARSAARLTHAGLVGVYDQGLDGEVSYLTMEYVEGITLRRRLAEAGALSLHESLSIIENVLDALSAAHRHGLVHRDIKPENVLMASDGRIKVADFGLARAVTEVTATTTGTVLGTVAYLGPELVSRGISDPRTDVYACGILLFEMITGRQPFTGETPVQVALQHVSNDIPAPSDSVSWLPQEIDDLVHALAARNPDDRPHDAAAALELVRRARGALDTATLDRAADVPPTITLHPATAIHGSDDPRSPGSPDDAETTLIDMSESGSTIALPIGVGVLSPEHQAEVERLEANRARRRRRWWAAAVILTVLAGLAAGGWWFVNHGPGSFTDVPEVVGLDQDRAIAVLTKAGLGHRIGEEFSHETVGEVIKTAPVANGQIARGGTVVVTISKGPDMREVPDGIVGEALEAASAALRRAGFEVNPHETVYDDEVPAGEVLAMAPSGDESHEVGTAFTLTVSDGPAPLKIISVVGATKAQAKADLERVGLVYKKAKNQFSDTVEKGRVISQSPEAGTDGHRTDVVTVTVSKGQQKFEIPDLVGKQYDEAARMLTELGMVPMREDFLGGFFGTVRSQSVEPGTKVVKGTVVVLTVV